MATMTSVGETNQDAEERRQINVGEVERKASLWGGGALLALGLMRRSWTGSLLALTGGALLYRGATGHCMLYQMLGMSTAEFEPSTQAGRFSQEVDREARTGLEPSDAVEQASYDSFPASDPPGWTSSRR